MGLPMSWNSSAQLRPLGALESLPQTGRSARDTTKPSMKRPTLTFFQANNLCRSLVPIGDAIWKYMEQLRADGYSAFDARNDFVESFGGPEEVEVHRHCAVEEAKLRLGQPWPMKL